MANNKRNARGITLIALVITIIVLLILAGVTIAALSGDNGILKRATQAKTKTVKENAEEQIKLAIMTATAEGLGEPDKTVLRNELTKGGITVKAEGENLPWEVTTGKYTFTINEDFTIEEVSGITISKKEVKLLNGQTETITATLTEGVSGTITWESSNTNVATVENGKITATGTSGEATITAKVSGTEYEAMCKVIVGKEKVSLTAVQIAENKEKYYGKIAENYTAGGLTYRIFYVDTENKFGDGANTVYLKADYKKRIELTDHITYNPEGNDLEVYKRMNPLWSAQRGSIAPASWNNNERVAGWLCSPTQWTDYLDNTKARYAIGGPSAEMYVASYNDVAHSTGTVKGGLSTEYSTRDVPGYIYKAEGTTQDDVWSTNVDTLDYNGYECMYAEKNGDRSAYCWLTSPSSFGFNFLCFVYGGGASLKCGGYMNSNGIGPLVSLKSGVLVEITE